MAERRSTARSRDLGKALVKIRKKAGFTAKDMVRLLDWDGAKGSRAEKGRYSLDDIEIIAWLSLCKAVPRMAELLELNRESKQDSWLQLYGRSRTLFDEESEATGFVSYDLIAIPGLLQTEPYIRALVAKSKQSSIAIRLDRQKILEQQDFESTFYVDEQVLRRPVGGSDVMHDQLMHMLFMMDRRNITVRVVPISVGWHSAASGSFVFLDSRLVVLETKVANIFLENADHIATFKAEVAELETVALSEAESQKLIAQLADEAGHPRRSHDLA
jgi:hypothetical protein